jgi:hypothetical protein
MGSAPEQLAADQLLQRPDLAAQRRLGEVQRLGRAAEVQLLGDRHEGPQVAQLDRVRGPREGEHASVVHDRIIPAYASTLHADPA